MLRIAGYANFLIAFLHIICLFWADTMFEVTGQTEPMAQWSAVHPSIPYLITIVVAIVFFIFGLYALSAADTIRTLPLLKLGIFVIATIYIVRGLGGLVWNIIYTMNAPQYIYSIIALIIGSLFLFGGITKWYSTKL